MVTQFKCRPEMRFSAEDRNARSDRYSQSCVKISKLELVMTVLPCFLFRVLNVFFHFFIFSQCHLSCHFFHCGILPPCFFSKQQTRHMISLSIPQQNVRLRFKTACAEITYFCH